MIYRSYRNNQTEWKKTYECDITFIDKRKEILRKKKEARPRWQRGCFDIGNCR